MQMIIYIAIMVILFIFLLLKFLLKIRKRHSFKCDKIVQRENDDKKTLLYRFGNFVDPITCKYINRYTLIQSGRQRSCIVSYDKPMKSIKYYVYAYKKSSKLIDILEIVERNTNDISNEIYLPKKCRKVNIKVVEIDGQIVRKPLRKNSFISIMLYSLFSGAFVLLSIFGILEIAPSNMVTIEQGLQNNISIMLGVGYFLVVFIFLCSRRGREVES